VVFSIIKKPAWENCTTSMQ